MNVCPRTLSNLTHWKRYLEMNASSAPKAGIMFSLSVTCDSTFHSASGTNNKACTPPF